MPLIQLGQEVRLQFEGWPAVQFPGWPSIAVGTFSGQVATVDATDDGFGSFRILVIPGEDVEWPSGTILASGRAGKWLGHAEASDARVRDLAAAERFPCAGLGQGQGTEEGFQQVEIKAAEVAEVKTRFNSKPSQHR